MTSEPGFARPAGRRWTGLDGVAEYLDDTPRHIRELVANRKIPHTKLGGKLRFDLNEIDQWMDRQRRQCEP